MVKHWLALHGGSSNYASPYATSSAVAHRGLPYPARQPVTPWMCEPQSRKGYS